jgi:hypothetical protein
MNSTCFGSRIAATLLIAVCVPTFATAQHGNSADLPSPISALAGQESGSIDDFGEGPVKPAPYHWLQDDPATPTSRSTVASYATYVEDVDPNNLLERPGIPVGWFANLELTAANPRISTRMQSGSLLSGTFADPVAPQSTSLNWTAMPKFTLGYRRPEGLGDLSASYRFLSSQGSDTISPFGTAGSGSVSSRLQLHVLDLDCTFSDLFPSELCFVPRQIRLTGGVRVAGVNNKTSISGGNILGQSASNTFVGAGPRFALESLFPIASNRWTIFAKAEAAGMVGNDWQSFNQTVSGPNSTITSASAISPRSTVGVPVVGLRTGVNWLPDWGNGGVKISAGFQWERWFFLGTGSDSNNELTILGPFVQGEMAF